MRMRDGMAKGIGGRAGRATGGLTFWESGRRIAPQWLEAMAGCVSQGAAVIQGGSGQTGLFGVGIGTHIETGPRAWVVADMDLVNMEELRELAGSGVQDDGLLGALYALEGPGFVGRLRGAFAFALWDSVERQLMLAADHFGMRRMYYASVPNGTAFSTRLGALLSAPGIRKRVDASAVYSYLNFHFIPAPATPYEQIYRLPAGHVLVARQGATRVQPFWDMVYVERPMRVREAASRLHQLTEAAVARALKEVKVSECGAFLSGGTDSSTVVGMMTRLRGEGVNTFSIGFSEARYNELDYAERAARHFGAVQHSQIVSPQDALAALPQLVEIYDEPFGNNSALGTFLCAKLAKERGVNHLLAGDGGDEIFGGNERYRTDRIFGRYHAIPGVLRRRALEPVLNALPSDMPGPLGLAQRYVRRANRPNPERFYSYEFFVAQNAAGLLTPEFREAVDPESPAAVLERHFRRVQATSELNRLMYLDLKLTIGDDDLFKVTRTGELAGVGVRFPMLDLPLVEYTGTLPADFKVRGLEKRYLFKRAFRELLPPEILAKRKHGFGVPTSTWLKTDRGFRALAHDTLLSRDACQRGYFTRAAMDRLFALHEGDSTSFYGDRLWSFLMMELWHGRHAD